MLLFISDAIEEFCAQQRQKQEDTIVSQCSLMIDFYCTILCFSAF
jgi:hypothetical protein